MLTFDSVPLNAALFTIYSHAGKMFEEQVKSDPRTDYTQRETFNTAIWFIAEKAKRRGFLGLQTMSVDEIAADIANQITDRGEQGFESLLLDTSFYSILSHAGRMLEQQIRKDRGTDYTQPEAFKTAIWFIAEKAKRRGFVELSGMTQPEIARAIGDQFRDYQAYKARHPYM